MLVSLFFTAQLLFTPSLGGLTSAAGVPASVVGCSMGVDTAVRADVLGNIILCGGGTGMHGFGLRLVRAAAALAPVVRLQPEHESLLL